MSSSLHLELDVRVDGAPVAVVGLEKRYGDVRAVDGVSLDVAGGEFLALLGPSGSGKTTILMTIAGFERPTQGSVLIGGQEISHLPAHRRNLGMVFQRYALFPHMTVHQNIAYPLRMRGVPREQIDGRVRAVEELVRLVGYGGRLPSQLSGGEQQRVALARAIVYRPAVLLMDEPMGALDKKLKEQLQLEIKHLQQHLGATVIYVTHDQEEAMTMADRIAVLHRGRLQQIGPPQELYERPTNSFVADFLGETNFVDGRLVDRSGAAWLVDLGEGLVVPTAPPDNGVTPALGAAVRLAIRPEQVALAEPSTGGLSTGQVTEMIYAGATVSFVVSLGAGIVLKARLPTSSGRQHWLPGDRVAVAWGPGDARIYEVDDGAP